MAAKGPSSWKVAESLTDLIGTAAALSNLQVRRLPGRYKFGDDITRQEVYIEEEDTIGVCDVDCGMLPHLWLLQDLTIKAKKLLKLP
nr:hypothetical protein [Tanacetum cinerariifolium]